jgi:hypothetical protein
MRAMHQNVLHFKKQLGQVLKWLDIAVAHAEAKKFDPNLYLSFRLAPDQAPFAFQIRNVCDTAKLGASRLTGKDAPKHEDNEKTIDELRARIKSVIEYLDGYSAKDFESSASRTVTTPRWEGRTMTGADYFTEHVNPNFHFHMTTAYAILRHNGVPLGKKDYLGPLTQTSPA